MNKFDLSTSRIEDFIGKGYSDLPYSIRALFHKSLSSEEINALRRGRANKELLDKAQGFIEEYHTEINPTWEQKVERQIERNRQNRIDELTRMINRKKVKLEDLNRMAELDQVLPIGLRKNLREQIESHTKELETINPAKTTSDNCVSEETVKIAVDFGLDGKAFMESFNNNLEVNN